MEQSPNTLMEFWQAIWQMMVDVNMFRMIGALCILIVGWLIAVLLSSIVGRACRRLGEGLDKQLDKNFPDKTGLGSAAKIEKVASRIVFYLVLLLTILGCLTTLNLSDAAAPIRDFVKDIFGYGANLIGAGLLLFIAWIIASVLEYFTLTAMKTFKIDEKLKLESAAKTEDAEAKAAPVSYGVVAGKVIYWVTFLLFTPMILKALKIEGITAPLEGMLAKTFAFVPHLVIGALILVAGLFFAGIVRKAIGGLAFIVRLDEIGNKAGCRNIFGDKGISYLVGLVAYVLVAIPVVMMALNAFQIAALTNSVTRFYDKILNSIGDVIGAGILILVAFVVGSLVSGLVAQLFEGFGFNRLIAALGFGRNGQAEKASAVVGKICFIAVMLLAAMSACEMLGFAELASLMKMFLAFGGNIIVGVIVMMVGIYLANFVADALKDRGENSGFLATVARIAVLVFTGAIAISTLELSGRIVEIAFALLLGAICVAIAISFGLGGREFAAKKLEEWDKKLTKK